MNNPVCLLVILFAEGANSGGQAVVRGRELGVERLERRRRAAVLRGRGTSAGGLVAEVGKACACPKVRERLVEVLQVCVQSSRASAEPRRLHARLERAPPKIFLILILILLERKKIRIPELEKLES